MIVTQTFTRTLKKLENGIDDNCFGGDAKQTVKTWHRTRSRKSRVSYKHCVDFRHPQGGSSFYYGKRRNTSPNLSRWANEMSDLHAHTRRHFTHPVHCQVYLRGSIPRIKWVNSFENYPQPHGEEHFDPRVQGGWFSHVCNHVTLVF